MKEVFKECIICKRKGWMKIGNIKCDFCKKHQRELNDYSSGYRD